MNGAGLPEQGLTMCAPVQGHRLARALRESERRGGLGMD
jgi:hypothetical protein